MKNNIPDIIDKKRPIFVWSMIIAAGTVLLLASMLWVSFNQAVEDQSKNAVLYARMVENSINRTIESVETSMLSIADDIAAGDANQIAVDELKQRFQKITFFAPHLRQIVLVEGDRTIVDTRGSATTQINMDALSFPTQTGTLFGGGAKVGKLVYSRFLPKAGQTLKTSGRRSLIPLKLDVPGMEAVPTLSVIAGLNSSYIRGLYDELGLADDDYTGLYHIDGTVLLDKADTEFSEQILTKITSMKEEGLLEDDISIHQGIVPVADVAIRILEKYPLAVVIEVDHENTLDNWFAHNHALIIGLLASALAIILAIFGLSRELFQTSRLQEQVNMLSTAVHQSPVSILIADSEYRIQYANPTFAHDFGYDLEEVINENPTSFIAQPQNIAQLEGIRDVLESGHAWSGDMFGETKAGELRAVSTNISPVENQDGQTTHMIAVLDDITERKRFEEALHASEQQKKLILDTLPDLIWMKDKDFNYLACNPRYEDYLGVLEEQLIGKSDYDFMSSERADERRESDQEVMINGFSIRSEEQVTFAVDGQDAVLEYIKTPLFDMDGKTIGILGIARDVTERRLAEADIRKLSQVVEQSPVTVMITDLNGDIEYVNTQFTETSGYDAEEVQGKNPRLLKSGATTDDEYETLWDTISQGSFWNGIFHNKSKDGSLYWERATIGPLKNPEGEITGYIAVKEEISQQKEDEKQLRLAGKVFDTASEGIMVTDSENRIQTVNNAFCEITGYSMEEAIGQNPSFLSSGRHDRHHYQNMYDALVELGHWEGEIWNRRKSGEVYPEWLAISSILDEDGNLEGYVSLFSDITKRKQDEEHIVHQANFDPLTGLANRNLFTESISQTMHRMDRSENSMALLFIDLDRFKHVNDTLGHSIGDQLLQDVSKRLLHNLRKTDIAARLGGDEFAVILPDVTDVFAMEGKVRNILTSLASPFTLEGHDIFISASIGITLYPDDGKTIEVLLQNADSAMYQAKNKGRNDFEFFTQDITAAAKKRRELESALHQALDKEELRVYFQPIIDFRTGEIASAEALVRWEHPVKGLVPPFDFIPLAEEVGLIVPIGEWILREACREAAQWGEDNQVAPRISVNISSIQFQKKDLAKIVDRVLKETGLAPEKLTLEITESVLAEDVNSIEKQLHDLRALGVGLSIDDFGTGYSSLSYLKRFPITALKIDKAFVTDLVQNKEDMALVGAILAMAEALNLKVIAEGVELEEQADVLKDKGCDFGQGYLYSRPLPAPVFRDHIRI